MKKKRSKWDVGLTGVVGIGGAYEKTKEERKIEEEYSSTLDP